MAALVIHETDLFHPHCDPDDHWDLACQFALAARGDTELCGVMIDSPPDAQYQPDIFAVNQMNTITGLHVPCGVGSPGKEVSSDKTCSGVNLLLDMLKRAPEPVAIHIVGSSRDVAAAGKLYPKLFAEKCKGIYLNAGSGTETELQEYNVTLDPAAYAGIFEIPCPIYWMPCFHALPSDFSKITVGKFGTYYNFVQSDILPSLSSRVQNYFLYMFTRTTDIKWLSYLDNEPDGELLAKYGETRRGMWCTAGFLHTAGLLVDCDGNTAPEGKLPGNPVYKFTPVSVKCNAQGIVTWERAEKSNQYIFEVLDETRYQAAMTKALAQLVSTL
ncbi:hypothetical protein FACS1894105_10880 [Clostridia bacterium]|nr:hypothetical protein FACS1894105_10880 [Clostridia bacterium]